MYFIFIFIFIAIYYKTTEIEMAQSNNFFQRYTTANDEEDISSSSDSESDSLQEEEEKEEEEDNSSKLLPASLPTLASSPTSVLLPSQLSSASLPSQLSSASLPTPASQPSVPETVFDLASLQSLSQPLAQSLSQPLAQSSPMRSSVQASSVSPTRSSAPRSSAPRSSAPRSSAPRRSAPRRSAPRRSAPRRSTTKRTKTQRTKPKASGLNSYTIKELLALIQAYNNLQVCNITEYWKPLNKKRLMHKVNEFLDVTADGIYIKPRLERKQLHFSRGHQTEKARKSTKSQSTRRRLSASSSVSRSASAKTALKRKCISPCQGIVGETNCTKQRFCKYVNKTRKYCALKSMDYKLKPAHGKGCYIYAKQPKGPNRIYAKQLGTRKRQSVISQRIKDQLIHQLQTVRARTAAQSMQPSPQASPQPVRQASPTSAMMPASPQPAMMPASPVMLQPATIMSPAMEPVSVASRTRLRTQQLPPRVTRQSTRLANKR